MRSCKAFRQWIGLLGIFVLLLGLYGCGGSGGSPTPATKTTATGDVSTTAGTTTTPVTVTAPTGVALAIPASTTMMDGSGAPVTGSIPTSVSFSTTATDLPQAAQTLPTGTTLVSFADISMGTVKTFSQPVTLTIAVPTSAAQAGDTVVVQSFDSATGQWTFAGTYTVDSNGNVSPVVTHLSIWAVFKTATTPPPAQPSGVTLTPGNGQVVVSWDTVTGATGYNVYYGTSATALTSESAGATSGQAISGLTNGTGYYFAVTAVNATGESIKSTVASTVLAPSAPTGVTPVGGAGQATVSWTAATGASSYNIYYDTTSGVTTANPNKITGATNGQAVIGLTPGTTYYFVVTAVNATGESPVSAESSVLLVPAKPKGVSVSPGDSQADVTWSTVTGATSYNVYYDTGTITSSSPKKNTTGTVLSSTQLHYVVTGLQNGTAYNFAVTALDASGEGPLSSITPGTPNPTSAPGSPTGVSVTQGATGFAHVVWGTVSGATSYRVYYLQTSSSTPAPTALNVQGSSTFQTYSGTSTSADIPLTSGSKYWWFVVTALNGVGESGPQNNAKPTGGLTIP